MAEGTANQNQGPSNSINTSIADFLETMSLDQMGLLQDIDLTLKAIAKQDGLIISQSSLKDLANAEQRVLRDPRNTSRQTYNNQNRPGQQSRNRQRTNQGFYQGDWDSDLRDMRRRGRGIMDQFTDSLEKSFTSGLFGGRNPIADTLRSSINGLANRLGVSVNELGNEVGSRLGKMAADSFKSSTLGRRLTEEWNSIANNLSGRVSSWVDRFGDRLAQQGPTPSDIADSGLDQAREAFSGSAGSESPSSPRNQFNSSPEDIIDVGPNQLREALSESTSELADDVVDAGSKIVSGSKNAAGALSKIMPAAAETGESLMAAGQAGTQIAAAGAEAGAGLTAAGGAAAAAGSVFPVVTVAILGVTLLLDALSETLGPAIEGFKGFKEAITNAANRTESENSRNLELWKERIKADVKSLTEASFKVIEDSAQKVQQTWDNLITTVSATQGYDKAGVQDLWSAYAQRLTDNDLSSVVSSADIMDQLQKVIQSGLSGAVAEEFAYQATVLNSAVPTEDFFNYAQTYATIAANELRKAQTTGEGYITEDAAIRKANKELEEFAANLLYAKREISGGFATSLTNASDLFEKAAKIAYTSRTGDVSDISGVLASVSGLVGSIAPDLAGSLVDAVVDAATGGNSSSITALRAMAGTGASNTAFLNAFAKDPKAVFETLFANLAKMQNMSSANYMEVAEGLSQVFGVSMDAFARVDFNYLADAIREMNLDSNSLFENMAMLKSGETTSTESQLRMQKINEYMVEQGLAYVLDNEVARSIQEHMWAEQLNREVMENTFAVELVGATLSLFQGIAETIQKIVDILNPFSWIKKLFNISLTSLEAAAQSQEIINVLKAGVVGEKGKTGLYQQSALELVRLTSGNMDLHLTKQYAEMLGTTSVLKAAKNMTGAFQDWTNFTRSTTTQDMLLGLVSAADELKRRAKSQATGSPDSNIGKRASQSYYSQRLVSKSQASAVASSGDWREDSGYNPYWDQSKDQGPRTQEQAKQLSDKLNNSISKYVEESMSQSATSLDNLRAVSTYSEYDYATGQRVTSTGAHRAFMTQAEIQKEVNQQLMSGAAEGGSFEDWRNEFEKSIGNRNLDEVLADYGTDINAIKQAFDAQESARSSAAAKAKDLHEVQFWEDLQHFATIDFPHYMREWERYFIEHEAYTEATSDAYQQAQQLKIEESGEQGDAVLALAEALTENNMWQKDLGDKLKDPVVQTNALLAKILLVTEAIMQQNNETSVVSVPTSLSALGLGTTNV